MVYCKLNGITTSVARDTWRERRIHVGDIDTEAIDGSPLESRAGVRREWTFQTKPIRGTYAHRLRMLIEANGQGWSFDDATHYKYSKAGLGPYTAPTLAYTPITAKHGAGCVRINSTHNFGMRMQHRVGIGNGGSGWSPTTHGWAIGFWLWNGASWDHYIATGAVAVTRGSAANPVGVTQYKNGVAGSHGLGDIISVLQATTPFVGVSGYAIGGAGDAAEYDDLFFYPYQLPESSADGFQWATQLYTFASSYPLGMPPYVKLVSDALFESTPVEVVGRVLDMQQVGGRNSAQGASTWEAQNFVLDVRLREV